MPRRFGTRRAIVGDHLAGVEAIQSAIYNDPDAILYYDMQDRIDNSIAVAYNVGFGMPDGTELVINGSFTTDSGWTKSDAALTISGGKANWSGAQAGNADLGQASILTSGEVYRIIWTTSGRTAGTAQLLLGTATGTAQSTNDTFTEYVVANGANLVIRGNATFDGSVDDVSIEQLTTGRNLAQNPFFDTDTIWSKGTGWAIASGMASATAGSASDLSQASVVVVGTEYETIVKVSGRTAGTVTLELGTATGTARSTNDIFTERITAAGATGVQVAKDATFDGDIEFVIVRPVSNATNGRYCRNICLNPFFANWTADDPDDWTVTEVGDATSNITENPTGHCQIISDGTACHIVQGILAVGKSYVVTVHISTEVAGNIKVGVIGGTQTTLSGVGVHKVIIDSAVGADFIVSRVGACDVTIDYVRVEQILIEPSSAYSTPGDNPLDIDLTAVSIQQPSGNSRVGVMQGYNATTSFGSNANAEFKSIMPDQVGEVVVVGKSDTWAAGTDYLLAMLADANNGVYIYRNGTNIIVGYDAGGTAEEVTIASGSPLGAFLVGLNWDTGGSGAVQDQYNGVKTGATQTIAGEYVGNPTLVTGAASVAPASVLAGDEAHLALFDNTKSVAERLAFAQALGLA